VDPKVVPPNDRSDLDALAKLLAQALEFSDQLGLTHVGAHIDQARLRLEAVDRSHPIG
jgi:hypothetical protein